MILTGQSVMGPAALQLKLLDAVVTDSALLSVATKWAAWAETVPLADRRVGAMVIQESPAVVHVTCRMAKLQLPVAGSQGTRAALEAVQAGTRLSLAQGLEAEQDLFLKVLTSQQGLARRHAFFAVRLAQRQVQAPPKQHALLIQKGSTSQAAVHVAVIGAGTMGSGIALVLLQAGFVVYLADVSEPALLKGISFLRGTIESYVKRRKLTPAAAAVLQSNLLQTQDLRDLSSCQLVVEAVIEKMSVKKQIFATLNTVTPASAILLSNTSTLDLDQMAAALDPARQARFAGWHFFSPAHVMKLVEIVKSATTSSETVALLQVLTKRIDKTGVVVGNCDGFVGNRMLKPYSAETALLLAEGAGTIESVDKAFTNFGMSLGPFQMSDLAGNDIGYYVRKERGWVRDDTNPFPKRPTRYTEFADDMVSILKRFGQKAGKGWYDYDPSIGKGRTPLPSKEMADFVESYVTTPLANRRLLSSDEIIERVFYPLVNEGFKIMEEGIARSPSDIDVVYLYGYGWPAWRGGPMYWADTNVGLPTLLRKLKELSRAFPGTDHYEPSDLLMRCVSLGVTVEEYYSRGLHQSHLPHSKL
jgi:3-hydroxyacyl-CoA dehydrogenase